MGESAIIATTHPTWATKMRNCSSNLVPRITVRALSHSSKKLPDLALDPRHLVDVDKNIAAWKREGQRL